MKMFRRVTASLEEIRMVCQVYLAGDPSAWVSHRLESRRDGSSISKPFGGKVSELAGVRCCDVAQDRTSGRVTYLISF